jgi:uncharacterized protein (TIGR02117 family)
VLALAAAPLVTMLLAGCSLATTGESPPAEKSEPAVTVWVLDHGWHTAIVARRSDVTRALWPEVDDFPEAQFVEVAWGDREFYMAPSPTAWLLVRAAFLSSRSVLHVVGFSTPVAVNFSESAAVELRLSRQGFDAMTRLIHEEYQRDLDDRPVRLERGLYGTSWFYAARGRYHVLNTCNTWVLRMLERAGLAVAPAGVIAAGQAMRQVRRVGEVLTGAAPAGR